MPKFEDYGGPEGLAEDERITQIGCRAMLGNKVGFFVDSQPPGQAKAKRYKEKLLKQFPSLKIIYEHVGPTPGAYTIIVVHKDYRERSDQER